MKTIELVKDYNRMVEKMSKAITERRIFIMNALAVHNGCIERKHFCKTPAEAKEKDIDFEKQFNDITTNVEWLQGNVQLYITSVKISKFAGCYLINGVGVYDNDFYQDVYCHDESAIAYFIYKMLSEGRQFKQNERVMVELPNYTYKPAIVIKDTDTCLSESKKIQVLLLDNEDCDTDNIELKEIDAEKIYKMSGEVCPRCGKPLYYEHDQEIDYPYYCPECDENFYACEI